MQILSFLTSGVPSKNRINLQALTSAGPTGTNPVLEPLAVLHLDNQLYLYVLHDFEQLSINFLFILFRSWRKKLF